MNRILPLAALMILAGCASSGSSALAPEVEMFQLVGPADLSYPSGSIEIQFGLRIANHSGETITLRQVELSPMGMGGPYEVERRTYYFNESLAPSQTRGIKFWARAEAEGDSFANDANAPVGVRAVAIFESPSGGLRKVLTKNFSQHGVGPTKGN